MKMKVTNEWLKNKIETEPDMYDESSASSVDALVGRCLNTDKPCGTDTRPDGCPCMCDNCVKHLIKNQEPLGAEFQKVLDDNYWDLLA